MTYGYPNKKYEFFEEPELAPTPEEMNKEVYPKLTLVDKKIPPDVPHRVPLLPIVEEYDQSLNDFKGDDLNYSFQNDAYSPLLTYYKTIGKLPLLKEEEERTLAKQIKDREEEFKELASEWHKLLNKEFIGGFPQKQKKTITQKIQQLNGSFHLFDELLIWERERKKIVRELKTSGHKARSKQDLTDALYKVEAEISKCIAETTLSKPTLTMVTGIFKKLSNGAKLTKKQLNAEKKLKEILKTLSLTSKEIREAKNQLAQANLRLVISIAKKYPKQDISLSDLIQEGNLGLIRAIDTYDYRRGHRFITYAAWWIKQAIIRALDCQSRTVRTPVYVKEKFNKIMKASNQLLEKNNREPTLKEIAQKTHTPLASIESVIQSFKESVPLDTFNEEKGEGIIYPSLHYEGNSILDRVTSLHLSQNVAELLTVLTPQEREIIKLRFGIGKRSDHTLAEIGDKFNLSRERIRQILNVALDKLKKPHYLMELREFAELS